MHHIQRIQSEYFKHHNLLILAFFTVLALAPAQAIQAQCAPNPCLNSGLCQEDGSGGFSCRCPGGTTGDLCEVVDACSPNPCQNSGVCINDGVGGFSCDCPAGTSGTLCEVAPDPCDPNPCLNDGVCLDLGGGSLSCRCGIGFGGEFCELEIDVCDPNPCQNGGTCDATGPGTFACTCPAGTGGPLCDVIEGENVCDPNPCQNDGECTEEDGGFSCRCEFGFEGELCELIGDPCLNNQQCLNEGTCVDNQDGSFSCACAEGFEGEFCATESEPLGICNPTPCLNGGICFDIGNGTPFCNCPFPFSGQFCEILGDPCSILPCANGTCIDGGDGTFTCDCDEGFGGTLCDLDTNLCDPNPCQNGGVCIEEEEGISCACSEGFEGETCQLVTVDLGLGSLFDEAAGILTDFRSGFTGVLNGGVSWGLGQQVTDIELDGSGYVAVADPGAGTALDITEALSIVIWIRPDALGGTQMLVSKDNAYELEFGKVRSSAWGIRLNNLVAGQATTPVEEGVWQHLAMTWDGSAVSFYYNGAADGTGTFTGPLASNDSTLGVGGRPAPLLSGGPVFFFTGGIDDVRIFDRVLTAEEVAAIFNTTVTDISPPGRSNAAPGAPVVAGATSTSLGLDTDEAANCRFDSAPATRFADMANVFTSAENAVQHSEGISGLSDDTINRYFARCQDTLGNTNGEDFDLSFVVGNVDLVSNLAAFWPFDEGSGCDAFDATGAHDGSLGPDCIGGNAALWTTGINGTALDFDGNDDEVSAASTAAVQTPAELTISAWVRRVDGSGFQSILDLRDQGADGYDLYTTNQHKLFMRVNDGALTGNAVLNKGQWHHVTGVYDGSQIRLYVDGLLDASSTVGAKSLDVAALTLYIGRHFTSPNYGFNGDLDEVLLYTRGLTDIEVFETFLSTQP